MEIIKILVSIIVQQLGAFGFISLFNVAGDFVWLEYRASWYHPGTKQTI